MILSSSSAAIFLMKTWAVFLWFHLFWLPMIWTSFYSAVWVKMIHFGSSVNRNETTAASLRGETTFRESRDARDTQNQIWLQIILCFISFIVFWFSHAVFICFRRDKINFEEHNAAKFVFLCLRLGTFLNVIYAPVHVDFFAWCLLKKLFCCRLNVQRLKSHADGKDIWVEK